MFRLEVLPILLSLSSVKCFEINTTKVFFSGFLSNGTEVILHVHGDVFLLPTNENEYVIQQIIISNNYYTPMKYKFLRHMKPINILILLYVQTYSKYTQNVFRSMKNLIYATNTLVIYINASLMHNTLNLSRITNKETNLDHVKKESVLQTNLKILNSPSFKVVLNFSEFGDLTNVWALCNGSCSEKSHELILIKDLSSFHNGIIQLHKLYFWSANGKEIPAWVADTNSFFLPQMIYKKFSCDIAYKIRKYQILKYHEFCYEKQRLVIELSKIHNITFIKWPSENMQDPTFYSQDERRNLKNIWHEGLHLHYYAGKSLHYCVDTKLRNTTLRVRYLD